MEKSRLFQQWVEQYEDDPEYIVYGLLDDITASICEAMERQNVTRVELAERLGITRQQVTNFLNTPSNTTLKTVVRFARALGLDVSVKLQRPVTMTTEMKPKRTHWQPPALPATTSAMSDVRHGGDMSDEYRKAAT